MADNSGEDVIEEITDGENELDPLAGQELFEIPDELNDDNEAPAGAQTEATATDPALAEPPDDKAKAEQPRDPKTKQFVKAPKDVSATEEGQPPEPTQAGAPPAPGQAAEQEEPELEFSFRADKTVIPIKGSRITADGVFIPRQYMGEVQRLLSHGVVYSGSYKRTLMEAKQETANARAEVNESVEKADATLRFFADLYDRQEKGETDDFGRTPVEAWLDDFAKNRVKLEAQADLAAAKAFRERKPAEVKLEGFDDDPAAGEPAQDDDLEQLSVDLNPVIGSNLQAFARAPEFKGLTGAELARIRDFMAAPENLGRFFMRALEPVAAAEWGGNVDIPAGGLVPMPALRTEFAHHAKLILDARKSALELKTAEERNRVNGGNRIPPVTGVNGGKAPVAAKPVPKFKNKAEMDAWFTKEDALA